MDSTVIAAIISGCVALISPVVTYAVIRYLDSKKFDDISSERRIVLAGRWTGKGHQEIGPEGVPVDFPIVAELEVSSRRIQCTGKIEVSYKGEKLTMSFKGTGGFLNDRFFRLEYETIEKGKVQFGAMILELRPQGDTLSGRFLGYGALSEKLIYGTIAMEVIK